MLLHTDFLLLVLPFTLLVHVTAFTPDDVGHLTCPDRAMEGDRVTYSWATENAAIQGRHRKERFFYDPLQKLVAIKANWSPGIRSYTTWWIYNFPKGALYTIEGDHCAVSVLPGPFCLDCMPANSSSNGVVFGFLGPNVIGGQTVTVGQYRFNATGRSHFPTWAVFKHLLIDQVHAVDDDALTVTAVHYQNVVYNVTDPSVFVPPSSCLGQWLARM